MAEMEVMYLVVEYADKGQEPGGLAVIPSIWLDGCQCALWPPYNDIRRCENSAKRKDIPGKEWCSYLLKGQILFKSADWLEAKNKCKRLINHSAADSTDQEDMGRSKRAKRSPERFEPENNWKTCKFRRIQIEDSESETDDASSPILQLPSPPLPSLSATTTISPSKDSTSIPSTVLPLLSKNGPTNVVTLSQETTIPNSVVLKTFESVFKILEEIKAEQRNLRRKVAQAINIRGVNTDADNLADGTFPLSSYEEVNNLEIKLSQDSNLRTQVLNHLHAFNGSSINEDIRQKMKEIFTNELALMFNLSGRGNKGKRAFQPLKLSKIVFDAVRKNFPDNQNLNKEYCQALTNWFDRAKDRNGGRKARGPANPDIVVEPQIGGDLLL